MPARWWPSVPPAPGICSRRRRIAAAVRRLSPSAPGAAALGCWRVGTRAALSPGLQRVHGGQFPGFAAFCDRPHTWGNS